ncbi:6-carboxytetrahydropterin synthase [Alkalimonas sp.]|uniref:6-carboxytetrahydropterin synthase n=1 Tax=Alkalimonas sp. TaxID=1872453 RepID=UPI00263AAD30|nr:6-carboxytetrahydropterin synthase [Alkalimonas sp.]MCC5825344.1 6-carboxytetrahydropterin synthase [Alkalimonas sp.]
MILFVRDLTVIDFSYLCAERGLLGESLIVDVELHGSLDQASMVFDFGLVKKVIKKAIDSSIDHALAVPAAFQDCKLSERGEQQLVQFTSARGDIQVSGPAQAFALLQAEQVNLQSIEQFILQQLAGKLPDNVKEVRLTLRPEASQGFYYQYSHGLKKHDGNCQRIAHGHRSTIQIYQDGMLSPRLNKFWADRWQDIYLITEQDLCQPADLQCLEANVGDLCSRYQSGQGVFEICLPASHCEVVPCDTTVECLADYIAGVLKTLDAEHQYKVVAYEGVGKGAIAVS